MATTSALLTHLDTIRAAVNASINTANQYRALNSKMTNAAKSAELATVTTVPSALQHASDCGICTAWDGAES